MNHDPRMDLLRVAASFAVVWLHVSAQVVSASPDPLRFGWWVGNFADSLSRWCVPVFVMVSGALLLSGRVQTEIGPFYRRRAARALPPLLFWTLFYILLKHHGGYSENAAAILKSIVKGRPYYHLWYLYMLVGLYLVTPFLHQIVKRSSENLLLILVSGALVIAATKTLLDRLAGREFATFLPFFLPFVGYFLAGHYLYTRQRHGEARKRCLVLAFSCGILVALGTGALLTMLGPKAWEIMYAYLNPLVIVMSWCVFRISLGFRCSSMAGSSALRHLAPITLGIYLIHPFWLWALEHAGWTPFLLHPLIGIPLTTVAAYFLSAVSAGWIASVPFLRAAVK